MNEQDQNPEITAVDEPTPTFDDFNLHHEIKEAIVKMGFETPTPVQSRTYQAAIGGGDIIAMAQTGTGKTAAFGIPMAQKLDPKQKKVQALVLTPTRELALQVCKELRKIGQIRGITSAAVYGGASFTNQVNEVKSGASVVVGTPGRVLDHIRRKTIHFQGLSMLVLDEADEMLSMGFEKEISEIIESLPRRRQTLLFSATIPEDIRRLTKRYMGEAEIISVSGDAIAAKDVSHFVYLVSGERRQDSLIKVIETERPESALVFCNTRDETQTVAQFLKKNGYDADWLNSDLSQNERERVMRATRNGKLKFLVATDVAARGIDVSHLSHVINYTFPESLEVYVHRTGRTGRAGRTGMAISLIAPQDIGNLYMLRLTYKIFPVEKTLLSKEETEKALELDRLDALRKTFGRAPNHAFDGLAKRLMQDLRGQTIIANLLDSYFNEQLATPAPLVPSEAAPTIQTGTVGRVPDEDQAEITKVGVKSRNKNRSKPAEDSIPPRRTKTKGTMTEDDEVEACDMPQENPAHTVKQDKDEGTNKEIYINAGRRDGLRISELMKEVMQLTGLPRTALGKVRMLTRATFLSIPAQYFDAVLSAVAHMEVGDLKLKAEPAHEQ